MTDDCAQNGDPLKLVREGTSQDTRASTALDPASVPVNARTVAHGIVFAKDYAALLKRYDAQAAVAGDWNPYFGGDTVVPLAVAAIEDIEFYKSTVRGWFNVLNDLGNAGQPAALKDTLGYLHAAIGTLAQALDVFSQALPATVSLQGALQNLIRTALAPALTRLIACYKGGLALGVVNAVAPTPPMQILRHAVGPFADARSAGLSSDWSNGTPWTAYWDSIPPDPSVYGQGGAPDPFIRINHCSTHTLFRSVFDQFLQVFSRVVSASQSALIDQLQNDAGHAPHYALYLAFLQLLEHARNDGNDLTQRHLDFYYRSILGLKEKPAQPGHVYLLAELTRQTTDYAFAQGQLFKAGKDSAGKDAYFASDADFVANKASVAALQCIYRHGAEPLAGAVAEGRIFASPVANSADGLGAALSPPDLSWQPFFNKVYVDGALSQIRMPEPSIGFAVASHYLLSAEGTREFILNFTLGSTLPAALSSGNRAGDVRCRLTTAKGWLDATPSYFGCVPGNGRALQLVVDLDGAAAGVVPYVAAVHGYNFDTDLPMLLVQLVQDDAIAYAYPAWQGVAIAGVSVSVAVTGIKTLAVANDFGPVDLSKPFQPFGASPVAGSSLVIGSKEIFQKQLRAAAVDITWQTAPTVYGDGTAAPAAYVDFLKAGVWGPSAITPIPIAPDSQVSSTTSHFSLTDNLSDAVLDAPDFTPDEAFGTQQRSGFFRLRLSGDIGQTAYQKAVSNFINKTSSTYPSPPPQGPVAASLTMSYSADVQWAVDSTSKAAFETRPGQFFHLAPFGTAEQHAYLNGADGVWLLPQFSSLRNMQQVANEAEFHIGVAGLVPPQNLALLFQVVDGTANPLTVKPPQHIAWSYLAGNQWIAFPELAVRDGTRALLDSGIITFAMPGQATNDNTLLPAGLFWIRASVGQASDAVCRLQRVAAQALEATFADQGNAADFPASPLPPATITRLATPDAAVKGITQPFASFGGRGAEQPQAFYQRVSERLRHKNRAIALWDYEHLILDAYPQIYQVKCLNHTCYEPADPSGNGGPCSGGIYRELAPGHVTIVTLPNLQAQPERDPLKPFTSLGLLQEIQAFLQQRSSSFATLHVRNPQFEEVRVSFKLQLRDGYDSAHYTRQLQGAITRFLSPWAFSGTGTPSFGGRIYKSVLINFVEQQPYVAYVTDFQLFQDIPCEAPGSVDLDEVTGSRAISVLVSAPASAHAIVPVGAAPDQALAESCGCGT